MNSSSGLWAALACSFLSPSSPPDDGVGLCVLLHRGISKENVETLPKQELILVPCLKGLYLLLLGGGGEREANTFLQKYPHIGSKAVFPNVQFVTFSPTNALRGKSYVDK